MNGIQTLALGMFGRQASKQVFTIVVVESLSRVQLCSPMDCSMPGFLVLHYLPEFAQTQVHWVSDTVQPSHPLSPFSAPAFSLSQHQGLFQWLSSSHQVVKVLSFSISPSNEYSGLISFRNDWLDLLADQGLSRVFSSTTLWKHQFFIAQLSL